MKSIVFDTGPIISLTVNNLLFILPQLKKKYGGQFLIPLGVKHELIDKPFQTRRFKFEALQVQRLIDDDTLTVIENMEITATAKKLSQLANTAFSAHNHSISILQTGELEVLATALLYKSDAIIVDERITRTLLENPQELVNLMEKRLHMRIHVNRNTLQTLTEEVRHLTLLRSIELVTVAYERQLLDSYLVNIAHPKRELLESVLWALKMNGASVTDEEINTLVKTEIKE